MLNKKALSATAGAPKVFVEDVFSCFLYTGNGSTQTITNNIDLSTEGGLVWIKGRDAALYNVLTDTARGVKKVLMSQATSAESGGSSSEGLTAFNNNGFSLTYGTGTGFGYDVNNNGNTFVSWTFRKAKKFFDVVTYTGNGSNRTISHNLGSVPGCIMVKRTDTTGAWQVYHRANTAAPETDYLVLNTTAATVDSDTRWNDTLPTSTVFSLGTDATVNANGGTYVAYLFAHDAGGFGDAGDQSVIACGSYTGAYPSTVTVNLGWEPQYILVKNASQSSNWGIFDVMRGMPWGDCATLAADSAAAENGVLGAAAAFKPTPTGFIVDSGLTAANVSGDTHIYIAIRRGPMKTPTTGTSVFVPTVYTGTNVDNRLLDTTIAPDMVWIRQRDDTVLGGMVVGDRLRGQPYLLTETTAAEVNDADAFDKQLVSTTEYGTAFSSMNGVWIGNDATAKLNVNTTSNNHIVEAFKRAPSFFDVVCYAGTGSNTTISHNLGVAPELMIVKNRSDATGRAWAVYAGDNTDYLVLNTTAATADDNTYWNDTSPTASVFTVGTNNSTNESGDTFVAYLFASLAGVSDIGTYTGNGSSVTVTTGFQPRFILVKRTDSTGNWIVGDSARGLVAGDDPFLLLNSSAAEDTDEDWVDVSATGFTVNETAANANVNTGTYIYLAIA